MIFLIMLLVLSVVCSFLRYYKYGNLIFFIFLFLCLADFIHSATDKVYIQL